MKNSRKIPKQPILICDAYSKSDIKDFKMCQDTYFLLMATIKKDD